MGLNMVNKEEKVALMTFTFTLDPDTQEAIFAGNIEPQVALQILQNIVISDAVRKAKEASKEVKPDGESKDVPPVQ